MTSSHSWVNVLRTTLFFFVLSSVFFLFFAAFSIPYIDTVYFVRIALNATEVVTLGTFGLCWEYDGVRECSPGVAGYQIDDLVFTSPVQLPEISLTLTRALTLHVVAFVLALVVATIVLCSFFRNSVLGRWITQPIVLLALFVTVSFIIDIALFFSVRTTFTKIATVQIGNGTWLTLTSLIFLLMGIGTGIALPKPILAMEDTEAASSRDSWVIGHPEVLHITASLQGEYKEEGSSRAQSMVLPYDRSLKGVPVSGRSPKLPVKPPAMLQEVASSHRRSLREMGLWANISDTIPEEHPALSPLRRIPGILINGAHRDSTQSNQLVPTMNPSSSSQTPSRYAPSTYSTSRSDESSFTGMSTPQTLSRSSTVLSGSVFGRQPARRSTHDWLNYERRNGKDTPSRQFMNSVSTLGSAIHHFPAIPSPQSVIPASFAYFQLRDRFKEVDPSYNAEVRSMVSAVPSSDLELDVQTAPSTTPKITPRQLPKVPSIPPIPPDSDQSSLA